MRDRLRHAAGGAGRMLQRHMVTIFRTVSMRRRIWPLHAVGTVRSLDRRSTYVWVASESWSAICADGVLAAGDTVEMTGREGLTLQVRRLAPGAGPGLTKDCRHE